MQNNTLDYDNHFVAFMTNLQQQSVIGFLMRQYRRFVTGT